MLCVVLITSTPYFKEQHNWKRLKRRVTKMFKNMKPFPYREKDVYVGVNFSCLHKKLGDEILKLVLVAWRGTLCFLFNRVPREHQFTLTWDLNQIKGSYYSSEGHSSDKLLAAIVSRGKDYRQMPPGRKNTPAIKYKITTLVVTTLFSFKAEKLIH